QVNFPRNPTDFADLAALTERAIRSAANGGNAFHDTRVGITSDNRLVIVPGGLRDTIDASGTPANDLRLTGALGAETMEAYQSGRLPDVPAVSAAAPAVSFTLAATTAT